jgi:hypothetical protein
MLILLFFQVQVIKCGTEATKFLLKKNQANFIDENEDL